MAKVVECWSSNQLFVHYTRLYLRIKEGERTSVICKARQRTGTLTATDRIER